VERVKGEEETGKRKRNGSHANLQKTTANIGATIQSLSSLSFCVFFACRF